MNRRLCLPFLAALFASAVCSCAPSRPAPPAAFDLTKVRRIAVPAFEGPGGTAVRDDFIRRLVAAGITVTDKPVNVDAVLSGAVTEYRSATKTLIFLGEIPRVGSGGQSVVVTNPVVSLSGAAMAPETAAVANKNPQIVSVSATVNVAARLHTPSGTAVWAGEYGYEALDIPTATHAVVTVLARSLQNALVNPSAQGTLR